jgi:DNA-binding MarR family transcriptional regulator
VSRKEGTAAGRPLGWLMMKAASSMALQLTRAFAEAGVPVSPEQYGVLAVAARTPGSSQAKIAKALGRDGPSLTRLSDALVRSGLIVKEPCAEDRRAYSLSATARGKEALAAAERVVAREESFLESYIDPSARAAVADSMRRVIDAYSEKR